MKQRRRAPHLAAIAALRKLDKPFRELAAVAIGKQSVRNDSSGHKESVERASRYHREPLQTPWDALGSGLKALL